MPESEPLRSPPRFSIVTINFNNDHGLRETLRSVINQEYGDFEHITVDGKSSDDSVAVWERETAHDSRFSLLSERDEGMYDAMNKGLRQATGDIVVFLNSGDTFSSAKTLKFVARQWQENVNWEWGYGSIRIVNASYEPFSASVQAPFSKRKFELGLQFIPHPASFFSRELLTRVGPYDNNFGTASDQELYFRLLKVSSPVVWIEFLADFLEGGASSRIGPFRRELNWHKMRRKNDAFFVNSAVDYMFTIYVALKQMLVSKVIMNLLARQLKDSN